MGSYENKSTYVLYKENGDIFQVIEEGEPFYISNQLRPWFPVMVPKKKGKGTILVCRKYGDRGNVIEEFPLIHNKKGLWALTSGAARNGVFHTYREPQNLLEKQLADMGISKTVIERVDKIDIELAVGGQICAHRVHKFGYGFRSDGEVDYLTEPERAPEDHYNTYHRGCMVSTYQIKVSGGTYLIYFHIGTHMNGADYERIERIILTKDADEAEVVKRIKEL